MMTQSALQNEIQLHKKLSGVYDFRYEAEFSKMYLDYWNATMSEYLPDTRSLRVLECGCGTGPYLKDLVKRYERVYGTDSSLEMMKRIPAQDANLSLTVADIERLQFKDGSFDIVICREVLHHLKDPLRAISEISRVLKKGGVFILSETCNDSWVLRLPRFLLYKFSGKFTDEHKAFASSLLKGYFKKAGFSVNRSGYFGYIGLPLCIMPDFLPLLRFMPFKIAATKFLIGLDKILSAIPVIRTQAFDIIIQGEKN